MVLRTEHFVLPHRFHVTQALQHYQQNHVTDGAYSQMHRRPRPFCLDKREHSGGRIAVI